MEQKFTILAITRIPHDPLSSLQPVLSVAMSTRSSVYPVGRGFYPKSTPSLACTSSSSGFRENIYTELGKGACEDPCFSLGVL